MAFSQISKSVTFDVLDNGQIIATVNKGVITLTSSESLQVTSQHWTLISRVFNDIDPSNKKAGKVRG